MENIHVLEIGTDPALSARPIRAEVHAVNRASAEATLASFVKRYEAYELSLDDAPDYCISLPELGIHHDPDAHLSRGLDCD